LPQSHEIPGRTDCVRAGATRSCSERVERDPSFGGSAVGASRVSSPLAVGAPRFELGNGSSSVLRGEPREASAVRVRRAPEGRAARRLSLRLGSTRLTIFGQPSAWSFPSPLRSVSSCARISRASLRPNASTCSGEPTTSTFGLSRCGARSRTDRDVRSLRGFVSVIHKTRLDSDRPVSWR